MARLDINQFKSLLDSASQVNIILPNNPSFDQVAAALGLRLTLEKIDGRVNLICPDPMTVEFHRLVGVDRISNLVPGKNLVITFPGQTESVDKVSYNVENGILQLVVTPKEGSLIDPHKLEFVSGGSEAGVNILFGTANANEGQQYRIDGENLCEAVTLLLADLQMAIVPDAASNLFQGLETFSKNFTASSVTADTFEAAAILLRAGAKRVDNLAKAEDFPPGAVPDSVSAPVANPEPDWYEPKIYRGTTTA